LLNTLLGAEYVSDAWAEYENIFFIEQLFSAVLKQGL
jgi:hypothetical protein